MVSESRRRLNQRLRENWIEQNRKLEAPSSVDDSRAESDLTSLTWLIDLGIDCLAAPFHPSLKNGLVGCQHPSENGPFGDADPTIQDGDLFKERSRKPTHTYSAMITWAINETPEKQITVAGIYNWIRKNFAYYRETSASWKNSVRHCLSTNRRFQRVASSRDKFGKRFWRIVPDPRTEALAGVSSGASFPRSQPHRPPATAPRSTPVPDYNNISEAIRCIGRWETIDSTGESQGSDSADESSAESQLSSESVQTDLSSPLPPSSDIFSPDWSCDARLNEILRDLGDIESKQSVVGPGFESSCLEHVSDELSDRQRLNSFDNECLLANLNALNSSAEDWSLADLTQLSSCKPIGDCLSNSCIDDFSSYLLLDADLGFRTML